jgi:hypothetical protein
MRTNLDAHPTTNTLIDIETEGDDIGEVFEPGHVLLLSKLPTQDS